jgi:hypothetical protein
VASLLRRAGLSQLGACPLPNGLTINQEPSRPQANQFDKTVSKDDGKWWYQWQNTANTCGVEELWLLNKRQNEKVTVGSQTKKVKEFFADTVEHVYGEWVGPLVDGEVGFVQRLTVNAGQNSSYYQTSSQILSKPLMIRGVNHS